MSVQLQDRYNDGLFTSNFAPFGNEGGDIAFAQQPLSAIGNGLDSVSRMTNPASLFGQFSGSGFDESGGLTSIIQQLVSMIQQLLGSSSSSSGYGYGYEQYFSSASGGSNGDPHLSFNGSTWNNMSSQHDLLSSDSVPGGFRISTQATTPNANGVTYNQQATVTTNFGQTQVSLDKNGNATYTQNGVTNSLARGQSVNLGNGECVTRNQNGSLTINNTTPSGGNITTTMSENGNGVDVNVTASNVDLGGALVNGANGSTPQPAPTPLPSPITVPTRPVYQRYDSGG